MTAAYVLAPPVSAQPLAKSSFVAPLAPPARAAVVSRRRYHRPAGNRRAAAFTMLGRPDDLKSILVFGGGSTLGAEVVEHFTATKKWRVYTLDFYDASVECGGVNGCALPLDDGSHVPISLALPAGAPAAIQVEIANKCLSSSCADTFDVVLNATLGFSPAALSDPMLFDSCEYMYRTSVESSLVTAKLASQFMSPNGMLALIGSVAALPGTSARTLLGYGAAKASVHQIVRLLAGTVGTDLPDGSSVIAIVPEVLDTPLHRSMNDGEGEKNWTPCDVVASKLLEWSDDESKRPPNGCLISVATSSVDTPSYHSEHKFRMIQDNSFVQPSPL